jgi:type I restriction enzyme, R subunit
LFNEENTVEDLVRDILSSKLGWNFIPREKINRKETDVLVESILSNAIKKLNPEISSISDRIDEIIYKLNAIIFSVNDVGLITANEEFSKWIKNEQSMPYGPNAQHVPIKLIDFENIENNDFIVTTQYSFKSKVNKRPDLVLLVNGIPLVVIEAKTPVRPAISWADGALQVSEDYEKNIPEIFVPNVFSAATEGKELQYGAIGSAVEEFWSPWRKDDPEKQGLIGIADTIKSLFDKKTVLEMLQHYTVFANDPKGRKIKIIARYPQYEAVNLIAQRVLEGKVKRGLIWHFQGSGKSLLMVFAALRLRFHPELNNPTVIVVVDRLDLDAQIGGTFTATNVPNTVGTDSRAELEQLLKEDTRKVILTTIHKFGEADEVLNDRSNIIVFVDEAHRTQEGDLGTKMRDALPNAFLFGLTGTPINKRDKNTFLAFGAEQDENGYLHRYSFEESVVDGATLPINFEPRLVKIRIDSKEINKAFDNITDGLSDADQHILSQKAGQLPRLIKDKDRIAAIAEDIAKHYKEYVEPEGLKGQVVAYDRETCTLYKKALDQHMPSEDTAIVMTMAKGDPPEWKENYELTSDELDALLRRYKDPDDPLKLLIVTSKLLTGFDAPINQVMYLDKPMKDHGLLQAICRTNRPYANKNNGLIVDYIGVFDDVAKNLKFDYKGMDKVITNIEDLAKNMPTIVQNCLKYFKGVDRSIAGYEGLALAQSCIESTTLQDEFAADYSVLSRYWEILSPRFSTKPYAEDYKWLSAVYESVQSPTGRGRLIWKRLGSKTTRMVQDHIKVLEIQNDLDALVIDEKILNSIKTGKAPPNPKLVEIKIVRRLRRHGNNPKFVALGERLEKARDRYLKRLIDSIEFLKELLEIAKDLVAEEQTDTGEKVKPDEKEALTRIFEESNIKTTPETIKQIVSDIDDIVKKIRFEGWQFTIAGERQIKQEITRVLLKQKLHKEKELFEKAYEYIKQHY